MQLYIICTGNVTVNCYWLTNDSSSKINRDQIDSEECRGEELALNTFYWCAIASVTVSVFVFEEEGLVEQLEEKQLQLLSHNSTINSPPPSHPPSLRIPTAREKSPKRQPASQPGSDLVPRGSSAWVSGLTAARPSGLSMLVEESGFSTVNTLWRQRAGPRIGGTAARPTLANREVDKEV